MMMSYYNLNIILGYGTLSTFDDVIKVTYEAITLDSKATIGASYQKLKLTM